MRGKMLELAPIVGAINGLSDPDRYSWNPTLAAFGAPEKKLGPEPAPTYDPFDPAGWYKTVENASIEASMLEKVGGTSFLMEPHAASALTAMMNAAAAEGVSLDIGNTYRDYATQAAAYAQYQAGEKDAPVAAPGTSNHGWGLAVDFASMGADSPGFQWLMKNGARYGFTNLEGEPWHWEFAQDGSAPNPDVLSKSGTSRRVEAVATDSAAAQRRALSFLGGSPSSLGAIVTSMLAPLEVPRGRGRPPVFKGSNAILKEQLYLGFIKAGRPDLAKMVNTKDFQTWVNAESGWNPYSVSQYFPGHGRNFGLFQFWQGHDWTNEYLVGGEWTATPFEQAILVARYFPSLSPEDIREYAESIRSGSYSGWPT